MSRRKDENAARSVRHDMQYSPVDDLESSIWVLIMEVFLHGRDLERPLADGTKYLTQAQRTAYDCFQGENMVKMLETKETLSPRQAAAGKAFPQCPAMNAFMGAVLKITDDAQVERVVSKAEIEAAYVTYFRAMLDCLESSDSALDWTWETVFSKRLNDVY